MPETVTGWTEGNDDWGDWDDVSTEPPPQVDPGVYRVQVEAAEAKATSKEKKPQAVLTLRVLEGANGESVADRSTTLRFQGIVFTPEARFRIKQFCQSMGALLPQGNTFAIVEQWCADVLGAQGLARIKHRAPDKLGRVFAEVDRYLTAEQAAEAQAAVGNGTARRVRRAR